MLIDLNPGGAIPIVHDDRDSRRRDNRDGALAASRLTRWLFRREMPHYETLTTEGAQRSPEAIYTSGNDGHGDFRLMAFDGLSYVLFR